MLQPILVDKRLIFVHHKSLHVIDKPENNLYNQYIITDIQKGYLSNEKNIYCLS